MLRTIRSRGRAWRVGHRLKGIGWRRTTVPFYTINRSATNSRAVRTETGVFDLDGILALAALVLVIKHRFLCLFQLGRIQVRLCAIYTHSLSAQKAPHPELDPTQRHFVLCQNRYHHRQQRERNAQHVEQGQRRENDSGREAFLRWASTRARTHSHAPRTGRSIENAK